MDQKIEIIKPKKKLGRPPIKSPQMVDKVIELVREGKTQNEIAKIIGVSKTTITKWKTRDFEFAVMLNKNKMLADNLVKASMFTSALGYDREIKKVYETKEGPRQYFEKRHFPPNPISAKIWLQLRERHDLKSFNGVPAMVDLLMNASLLAFSEIERLKKKAESEGLTSEDHRSLSMLSKTLVESKEAHEKIIRDKEIEVDRMTDEELEKAVEEIAAKRKNEVTDQSST